jgi:hypothetical protein
MFARSGAVTGVAVPVNDRTEQRLGGERPESVDRLLDVPWPDRLRRVGLLSTTDQRRRRWWRPSGPTVRCVLLARG